MRRDGSTVFAIILILLGLTFLVNNLFGINVWNFFWPLLLIGLGVLAIGRSTLVRRDTVASQEITIPLDGAAQARLTVRHGAGRLAIGAGAPADALLSGSFGAGLRQITQRQGDTLVVDLRLEEGGWPVFFPFAWSPAQSLDWAFLLNRDVPITLDLGTGASETSLDLRELRVSNLRLETGASSTEIVLPAAAGQTRVVVHAGAASVRMRVPEEVGASIRVRTGLSGVHVNPDRFTRRGDTYETANYASAANRVDVDVEAGVGSIEVR